MTIGVVVKLRKTVVALADGRLSRTDRISFDTAPKITRVRPGYRYPLASMGAQERTAFYGRYDWCLLYAGTYALASEIREEFRQRVANFLVDQTDDGVQLVEQFSGRHRSDPLFQIPQYDLPRLPSRLVVDALKFAYEVKATEWRTRRTEQPDAEFLLFGTDDETEDYVAVRVSFDANLSPLGQPVVAWVDRIPEMTVYTIGSKVTGAMIDCDPALLSAVAASVPSPSRGNTIDDFLDDEQPSETIDVAKRLVALPRSTPDPSVGGKMLVAVGEPSHTINVYEVA